jgi:hypothetical protein
VAALFQGRTHRGDLTVLYLMTGEAVSKASLPLAPFLCGVRLSDPGWSEAWLTSVIRDLIEGGAVYLAFHGPRCEEAHDIADRVRDIVMPNESNDVVMTTWHEGESLVDYLWDLAYSAIPSPGFNAAADRYCVLDVGKAINPTFVSAVREVFVP